MNLPQPVKRIEDLALAVLAWRRLIRHDSWRRQDVRHHQQAQLDALVRHAVARSPFYRQYYRGLDTAKPIVLGALPRVDKRTVMANFDQLVTDPRLTLAALEDHLRTVRHDDYYLGEYRVLATAGTSGFRGVFVFDRAEWRIELANALRWHGLMGVRPRLFPRVRMSAIGADSPVHVSARLTASSDVGLFRFQRLPVTMPLRDLARALDRFRPEVLLAYPSVAALLALEELAGRLDIHPRIVSTHSELMTGEMSRKIERAWGTRPFNHYGLTELSTFGAECEHRRGMHMLDDLFIAEIVDDAFRPVEPGRPGRRLLLTNLYNYTQPLIRYDVSDMLTLDPAPCSCGRPFPLIAAIEGRQEEIVELAGRDGRAIAVSPLAITGMIEALTGIAESQVLSGRGTIRVRFVPSDVAGADRVAGSIRDCLGAWLAKIGAASTVVQIDEVAAIERSSNRMGKIKLVEASKR